MQVDPTPPGSAKRKRRESSRREFLEMTLAGGAIGLMAKIGLEDPPAVSAQTTLAPEAALEALMAGNRRFVSGRGAAREHDLAALRRQTANRQAPFASVLACADSRVPVELLFDQSIGHIFTARVAGNIVTPEIMGSLEYGALVLGTKVILVLGHAGCGAVKATIEAKAVPGQIGSLFPHIQPAIDEAGQNLDAAIRANAKIQAKLLRESSPALKGLIQEGKLKVAAAHYDLATGNVTLLS